MRPLWNLMAMFLFAEAEVGGMKIETVVSHAAMYLVGQRKPVDWG